MLDSGLWHFLAKAGTASAFPLGLQEDEMRVMPRWSVGCGVPVEQDHKRKQDLPMLGPTLQLRVISREEELLKCPAGAGRAVGSVWARGEQAAGHFSDTMGQMLVSSEWPAGSSVPLSSSA